MTRLPLVPVGRSPLSTLHSPLTPSTRSGLATRLYRAVLSVGLLAILLVQSAVAQVTIPAPALQPVPGTTAISTAELQDVVSRGEKLENQRRWGEALSLYEDTFRHDPSLPGMEQRIDLARIHYDLGRRYADNSYRRSITQLDENRALDLYTEVLGKVNTHYVLNPDWKHLVDHGTLDLEVALNEPTFATTVGLQATPEQINDFRRELHALLDKTAVRDPAQARELVTSAAHLAHDRIGLSTTAVVLEYTSGAGAGMDEYSTFLTADQLNDLYSQIEGNFVGLGIELKASDHALLIVNVLHGSPAERGGIKTGDRITAVAGHSTRDLTTDGAAQLLQGQEGTTVDLVAVTGNQPPRQLTVRREHVEVPSIDDVKIIDANAGIGYLKLTCFEKTTSRDLDAALWKLNRQGMKSLVMDLRGNPGGLLTASVDVADKFIDQGSIVSTRGRSPQEDYNYTAHAASVWHIPLVVLIDGDSASASEIFAGAVRDHHRGVLVGTRSYGKGSVQGIFPLGVGGNGLRLTTAKFYSPDGHPFVRVGVEPDIVVRQTAKPIDGEVAPAPTGDANDAILAAGLQAARRQLAQR